jgi:predicted dehydrogenase
MSPSRRATRRAFLRNSTALAAGAAAIGGLSVARSAHAFGSDQLKVALIGCGGRGSGAANDQLSVDDNVKLVAVADAFEERAKGAVAYLKKSHPTKVDVSDDRIFVGLDAYQKAIDSGVDMVILAEPPGFRPVHYKAAVDAGKHVFMEKPCCVDAPGYRTLVEANKLADEKGLKVGVGLQRHHQAAYIQGVKELQEGKIGDFLFARCYWNGGGIWHRNRKPNQKEMEYQIQNWYHFIWLSGDNICEQHVHNLDVANWVKGDHPAQANGMGYCIQRYTNKTKETGKGQIFDYHFVEFTYKDGTKLYSQCRQIPNTFTSISETIHGTKGAAVATADGGPKSPFGNPYQQEHFDLLAAIRKGERYNEGHYGATSSFTAVLGRMATYSGKEVKWDEAVRSGPSEAPDNLDWDAIPKAVPDANGDYPIATPGQYKPY